MVLENKVLKLYEEWVCSTNQEKDVFIPFTKTDSWSGYMVMEFSKFILMKVKPLSKKDMVLKWCEGKSYIDKHKAWERFNRIMSYGTMNCAINKYIENRKGSLE